MLVRRVQRREQPGLLPMHGRVRRGWRHPPSARRSKDGRGGRPSGSSPARAGVASTWRSPAAARADIAVPRLLASLRTRCMMESSRSRVLFAWKTVSLGWPGRMGPDHVRRHRLLMPSGILGLQVRNPAGSLSCGHGRVPSRSQHVSRVGGVASDTGRMLLDSERSPGKR